MTVKLTDEIATTMLSTLFSCWTGCSTYETLTQQITKTSDTGGNYRPYSLCTTGGRRPRGPKHDCWCLKCFSARTSGLLCNFLLFGGIEHRSFAPF